MDASELSNTGEKYDTLVVLSEDSERAFCRLSRNDSDALSHAFIPIPSGPEHLTLETTNRLAHEFELKDYLDSAWALRPLDFVRERGGTKLLVEYSGGVPLDQLIGTPMEVGSFLRIAVSLTNALGRLHGRGLIHKDIKPANVFVNSVTGQAWLTGFGIASRLPRERQAPAPPETAQRFLARLSQVTHTVARSSPAPQAEVPAATAQTPPPPAPAAEAPRTYPLDNQNSN